VRDRRGDACRSHAPHPANAEVVERQSRQLEVLVLLRGRPGSTPGVGTHALLMKRQPYAAQTCVPYHGRARSTRAESTAVDPAGHRWYCPSVMATRKRCPRCGRRKKLSGFYRDKSRTDGVRTPCRACMQPRILAYSREQAAKGGRVSTSAQFWAKVRKTRGCWLWIGTTTADGYGRCGFGRGRRMAHRFSWELRNGPIKDGLLVLHRCDNPPCVRPSHLFLGTDADNSDDMIRKGRQRHPSGEQHGMAKLTAAQVAKIRSLGKNRRYGWRGEVAKRFGISVSHVSHICGKKERQP
jgi:hypothetical protein